MESIQHHTQLNLLESLKEGDICQISDVVMNVFKPSALPLLIYIRKCLRSHALTTNIMRPPNEMKQICKYKLFQAAFREKR